MSANWSDEATKTWTPARAQPAGPGGGAMSIDDIADRVQWGLLQMFDGDQAKLDEFARTISSEWCEVPCSEIEQQADRIAELERREALLTAFVVASDSEWEPEEFCEERVYAREAARDAIDWLPRYAGTSEPTYQDDLSTGPDVAQ